MRQTNDNYGIKRRIDKKDILSLTLLFSHDKAGNFHGAGMGRGGFTQWREFFRNLFAPTVKPAPVM